METLNRTPLTLSELCARIGEALDDGLAPSYWVKAEVSSLSRKGGHLYLDLIDSPNAKTNANAKMRATCWSGTQELLTAYFESETGQPLQAGMAVLVEVEVQWHAVYGLSLSIIGIDPSYTIGDIAYSDMDVYDNMILSEAQGTAPPEHPTHHRPRNNTPSATRRPLDRGRRACGSHSSRCQHTAPSRGAPVAHVCRGRHATRRNSDCGRNKRAFGKHNAQPCQKPHLQTFEERRIRRWIRHASSMTI